MNRHKNELPQMRLEPSHRPRRLRVRDSVLHREVGGEVVILDVERELLHGLQESAVFLWRTIVADAPTRQELVQRLVARYGIEEERAAADVDRFLDELVAAGLIEPEVQHNSAPQTEAATDQTSWTSAGTGTRTETETETETETAVHTAPPSRSDTDPDVE